MFLRCSCVSSNISASLPTTSAYHRHAYRVRVYRHVSKEIDILIRRRCPLSQAGDMQARLRKLFVHLFDMLDLEDKDTQASLCCLSSHVASLIDSFVGKVLRQARLIFEAGDLYDVSDFPEKCKCSFVFCVEIVGPSLRDIHFH